ncbi:MAG: HU family DNA-binding protein [Pseudomonadota bacterium]|nr:integration host factor [Gammaproteobacteria bacterium]MEC8010832.1 HU family DNA-binding protein [Pseudomonadota bacterium]HBF09127.1 integration host factor [Gammaproteobacteria bacterium]|tara:strand:+ start:369 stop:785 length:417 start_codon:yes stop_codon:yes gene_type:complete
MAAKKTTAKKTTATKAAPAKAPAKKAAAPKARKITAVSEPMTKTALLTEIAENSGLSKKEVQAVLDELAVAIERHVKKRAVGEFTLPGLMKIVVQNKPAVKARKGRNPFTGEEMMFKAKPARNVIKVRPLKKLKDMAS